MLKKFLVKIWAYDHYAKFEVLAEDSATSIEHSILDTSGDKSIHRETKGMLRATRRITYEDVLGGTRPVQTQKVRGVEVAVGV